MQSAVTSCSADLVPWRSAHITFHLISNQTSSFTYRWQQHWLTLFRNLDRTSFDLGYEYIDCPVASTQMGASIVGMVCSGWISTFRTRIWGHISRMPTLTTVYVTNMTWPVCSLLRVWILIQIALKTNSSLISVYIHTTTVVSKSYAFELVESDIKRDYEYVAFRDSGRHFAKVRYLTSPPTPPDLLPPAPCSPPIALPKLTPTAIVHSCVYHTGELPNDGLIPSSVWPRTLATCDSVAHVTFAPALPFPSLPCLLAPIARYRNCCAENLNTSGLILSAVHVDPSSNVTLVGTTGLFSKLS